MTTCLHTPSRLNFALEIDGFFLEIHLSFIVIPQVLVAVCTYNERSNIEELVARIFAAMPDSHLLIVDDDSPDGTSNWVMEAMQSDDRLRLIVRKETRGLGGATRTAFKYAVDHRYLYLLNLDGDLSHDPAVLPVMLDMARDRQDVDVIVGSRYVSEGAIHGWPLHRRLMSRTVNFFAKSILRLPVIDCSGSMRCYRVSALAAIDPQTLTSESYSILEEVLMRLNKLGCKMIEIPIQFMDRERGSSKLTTREAIKSATHLIQLAIRRR